MTAPALPGEWLINNVPLETLARQLSTYEGMQESPEPREGDLIVPGMHGELDIGTDPSAPRRSRNAARIPFSGWLQGVDPDTGRLLSGTSHEQYLHRVDELMALFAPRLLVVDHVRPDGIRRAYGRRVGGLSPARERTAPVLGRWSAMVKIPSSVWTSLTEVTITGQVQSGGVIPLGALGVGNAPITDLLITFGPGNNPLLAQGGTYLAYDGVIGSGRQLAVATSPADPSVGIGTGAAWSPLDSSIRYGPNASWFEIDPTSGPLTLTHTGGGLMQVWITARPTYDTS